MSEIKVSDYKIFDDASNTVKKVTSEIESLKVSLDDSKTILNNEAIFKGPICDSCIEGLSKCNTRITAMYGNYNTIIKYLNSVSTAYQNGDKQAANKVLKLENGKIGVGSASASTGKKSGNNNRDYVHDYLASQGFNEAAICGILANIRKETNFRSDIGGDYGTSYGMCGWHASRWDRLKNYCDSNNLDIRTIQAQSQFLVWELKNCYSGLYKTLKNIPNTQQGAYDAAREFTLHFERPANMQERSVERGNIAANEYYPFYTK